VILDPVFLARFKGSERVHAANQQTAQDAATMPEQQGFTQSDAARLASTNFYVGQTWFPEGDSIEIASVERTKGQMTVRGHCNLVSHNQASLELHITTSNGGPTPTDAKQHVQIPKGQGSFELTHPHVVPGLPHVSMYADGHPFASLYFGTKAEALEESAASWIANTPSSAKTQSPTP
jgi:hypothetical protein